MNDSIKHLVADHEQRIHQLCSELSVRDLRIFGSALTDAFDPTCSDVDVIVEFFDAEAPGIADRFMALAVGLEAIFQRPVDLVTRQAVKNPVFRRIVEETSEALYAA